MKLQTQGKRSCSRGLLIRTDVSALQNTFPCNVRTIHRRNIYSPIPVSHLKKTKKKPPPKLENCLGNQSLERAACGEASRRRSSGVAGAAEAGSPAAVRGMEHSYADGISSSSSSLGSASWRRGARRESPSRPVCHRAMGSRVDDPLWRRCVVALLSPSVLSLSV